jgi:hypothetical protein
MKAKMTVLFAMIMLFETAGLAQNRFEIFGDYSYLHFNPTVTGISSRSFNGGGGGLTLYFLGIFGIKADFMAYGSSTFSKTFPSAVISPGGGIIPAGTYTSQGDMFTYMAGPVIRIPIPGVKPFGEILFGGSNANGYVNLTNSIIAAGGTISETRTQHPFTMAVGGGLDISVSKRLSIRPVEADYVLSLYSNPLTSANNQNNFRYCAGLVFKF